MTATLGALTVLKTIELGNCKHVKFTLVGASTYTAGGESGLLSLLRTALGDDGAMIHSLRGEGTNSVDSVASVFEYVQPVFHDSAGNVSTDPRILSKGGTIASGDKLLVRNLTDGVENGDATQNDETFTLIAVVF